MLGRLDRYVGRIVLGSYVAGLVFMTMLFTLMDLLVNLQRYMDAAQESGTGSWQLIGALGWFYLLGLPVVFLTIAPFVTVIAAMFAVSRLMAANEVVPMLFTGRGILRVLTPVFLVAGTAAGGMAIVWEFVVPDLNAPLAAAARALEGKDADSTLRDVVIKVSQGAEQTLFVDRYYPVEQRMKGVWVIDRGSTAQDVAQILAREAVWDPAASDWRLTDGRFRTPDRSTPRELLGLKGVTPDLLWRSGKEGRETVLLSYSELQDLRSLRPQRTDLVIAFHTHITFPIANIILLLLALPFAVYMERGRRVERIVFSIVVCGAYLVFDLTCQQLGRSMLHPVLASWLPTILFGSLGVAFFGGIRT
ncbi:MAG: LptF/LptG family permease [Planctomycetes bacterium]|nr:LptF/LptG family permease [Planctomycetota bacterium]